MDVARQEKWGLQCGIPVGRLKSYPGGIPALTFRQSHINEVNQE
jgi:hypothetical protein